LEELQGHEKSCIGHVFNKASTDSIPQSCAIQVAIRSVGCREQMQVQNITITNIPCHRLYQKQLSIQMYKEVSFSSGEAAKHETNQLSPSSVEVKNRNGTIGLPPVPNVP